LGHPDFVLAAAVAAGVLRAEEAELIGRTRLEEVGLEQAAAELGISRNALLLRRSRAERRLAALRQGELSGITPAATLGRVRATENAASSRSTMAQPSRQGAAGHAG
jgi:predicted DNA-binding protein (UPF0251 family)